MKKQLNVIEALNNIDRQKAPRDGEHDWFDHLIFEANFWKIMDKT